MQVPECLCGRVCGKQRHFDGCDGYFDYCSTACALGDCGHRLLCVKCGKQKPNRGYKWCQECFNTAVQGQKCVGANRKGCPRNNDPVRGKDFCEVCYEEFKSAQMKVRKCAHRSCDRACHSGFAYCGKTCGSGKCSCQFK